MKTNSDGWVMKQSIAMTALLVWIVASFQALGQTAAPASSTTNHVVDGKREDAAVYDGHRYMIYTTELTWPDAKKACEDKGGHLVTFGDAYERDFVQKLAGFPADGVWIGMAAESWQNRKFAKVKKVGSQKQYYELEGNDFRWVDGKRGVRFWKSGVLTEVEAGGSESLYVWLGPKGGTAKWEANDNTLRAYICEWDR